MGLFDLFNNTDNLEAEGNKIIDDLVAVYKNTKKEYPNKDKHFWLSVVYLSKLAENGVAVDNVSTIMAVYGETMISSCLRESDCIKSLSLYILYKSRKDIIASCPQFNAEYTELTKKIYELATSHPDKYVKKYKKENPVSSKDKSVRFILKSNYGYK